MRHSVHASAHVVAHVADRPSFGALLREWRRRRQMSQLALALEAGVSQRHLSFVESGRAQVSRELALRLAEWLDVPLRERNHLLLAAGYAPAYSERALGDPALAAARSHRYWWESRRRCSRRR